LVQGHVRDGLTEIRLVILDVEDIIRLLLLDDILGVDGFSKPRDSGFAALLK
jgi:hypothetical protein